MSASPLLKMAPNALLVVFLAYAGYAIQSALPDAAERRAELGKGLDQLIADVVAEGSGAVAAAESRLRDPFAAVVTPKADPGPRPQDVPDRPEADALTDVVSGLSLDATFVQGRDQLAMIDGRIYSKGQRIAVPSGDPAAIPALQLLLVDRQGVILRGGGRNYRLGYPDRLGGKESPGAAEVAGDGGLSEIDPAGQIALFQTLLRSPLGAMGRGLIGDPGAPRAGSRGGRAATGRDRAPQTGPGRRTGNP